MTYYLKYRPQKLDDLDLEEAREFLKKIVRSKKIPHALLFSGPKGSGKTSAARILAKVVNCERGKGKNPPPGGEPCNKCAQCTSITNGSNIDVIEIDAASHRGIDEARTIRDAVKLAPAKAAKKVYIIDEAHMLTTEASNALLKTLEEPPEHVMFILATTNPAKLIETIRSRTTNVAFKKAKRDEVVRSLTRVAKGEKIKVSREVFRLIADVSDGSFRDAAKALEQLLTEKIPLKERNVEEFLFQRRAINVDRFLSLLARRKTKEALEEVENVVTQGASMRTFTEAVVERLRDGLLAKAGLEADDLEGFDRDELIHLIKLVSEAASEIPSAVLEQIPIELAVVEWCQPEADRPLPDESTVKGQAGRTGSGGNKKSMEKRENTSPQKPANESVTEEVWARVLSLIKPKNTSTEALLRAARPIEYDGKTLTIGVFYSFHKEKLETIFHRRLLEETAAEILGNPVRVVCKLTEPARESEAKSKEEGPKSEADEQSDPEIVLTESDSVLTEGEDEDIIKVAKEIFGN